MTQPPRLAEALLESLGAPAHVREPVLGDLAEEHAWLVDAVGEDAARRWYWREALHAAPLLLRTSLRARGWRNWGRAALITACALAVMAASIRLGIEVLDHGAYPRLRSIRSNEWRNFLSIALPMPLGVVGGLLGGYVAAALDRRTAGPNGLTLALSWLSLYASQVLTGSRVWWPDAIYNAIVVTAVLCGTMLVVRRSAHASAQVTDD